jgi:hypothetical protein
MQYKTITLDLLESHPVLADRLKTAGRLLAALETCSTGLRARHLSLTDQLSQSNPQAATEDLSRRAFEIALRELEDRIRHADRPETPAPADLLIEYLRRHTPPE